MTSNRRARYDAPMPHNLPNTASIPCLIALASVLVVGCAAPMTRQTRAQSPALPSAPILTASNGIVVSVSAPASEVGRDILRDGGNAVDAAVATAFALAVTFPEAGNIGGGGFMLVYPGGQSRQKPIMIDYRETAPAASTREMFATTKPSSAQLVGIP